MNYQVIIQPTAFQEIETSYRWMCDNLSPEVANNWYYEFQDTIASLQNFPNRCSKAPESKVIGCEVRQIWIGKKRKYRVLFVGSYGRCCRNSSCSPQSPILSR
jgi:plasmid stabilization system protein ParE